MISNTQWNMLSAVTSVTEGELHGDDPSHVLHVMNFALHDNRRLLDSAVDIIDDHDFPVKQYCCDASGRSFYKVQGSQGREYICLGEYCNCASFLQTARQLQKNVICKHLLCVKISLALGKVVVHSITEEMFVDMLCEDSHAHGYDKY